MVEKASQAVGESNCRTEHALHANQLVHTLQQIDHVGAVHKDALQQLACAERRTAPTRAQICGTHGSVAERRAQVLVKVGACHRENVAARVEIVCKLVVALVEQIEDPLLAGASIVEGHLLRVQDQTSQRDRIVILHLGQEWQRRSQSQQSAVNQPAHGPHAHQQQRCVIALLSPEQTRVEQHVQHGAEQSLRGGQDLFAPCLHVGGHAQVGARNVVLTRGVVDLVEISTGYIALAQVRRDARLGVQSDALLQVLEAAHQQCCRKAQKQEAQQPLAHLRDVSAVGGRRGRRA
mmetsp:Transcript_18905/g.56674  ORF Transcript_18905/g.56674 Transcript_18905/m.56674 type:complete len:292 (+) Transcript_18905:1204-2079(+)